ncbi:MAG: ice-binding family protein [Nitrosotalea sp.]
MKNFLVISILILSASGMASNYAFAAGTAPSLGTAGTFGVLASSTITAASASTVNGDLGISPGIAITGPITVSGTKHVADATAAAAHTDATTAYNALQSQTCDTTITSDLGGKTLTPGVYCSGSSMDLIGTLTLSGAGVYIFQMGSTLTTATDSNILLTGGATADNVFWQVGSSATFGTATSFVGTMIAQASITSASNTQTTGRLIALTGTVSLSGASPTIITVPNTSSPQTTVTPTPTQTTITPTPPVYEQSTSAITGLIQQNCYTGDYEYIDGSGSHFIKNVGEQYQYLVDGYNNAANAIKSSNPTISLNDLHDHLAQGQGYQKMIALENCFQTNGISPDSISPMNPNLSQVVAIPEFGVLSSLVVVISISGIIVMSKRSKFHF